MAEITTLEQLQAAEPAIAPDYVFDPNWYNEDPNFFHGGGGGGGGSGWHTLTIVPIQDLSLDVSYDYNTNIKINATDKSGKVIQATKFSQTTKPDGSIVYLFSSTGQYGNIGPLAMTVPPKPNNDTGDWNFTVNPGQGQSTIVSKGSPYIGQGHATVPEPGGTMSAYGNMAQDGSSYGATLVMPDGDQCTLSYTFPSGGLGVNPNALLDWVMLFLGLMLAAFGCCVMFEFLVAGIIIWGIGAIIAIVAAHNA